MNNKEKTYTETINPNTCCMCFGFFGDDVCYENGAGWVSCNCGGWLHEDCVEDYTINKIGIELFINFVLIDMLHKM